MRLTFFSICLVVFSCRWLKTLSNRASLLGKWWYSAPLVTRAAATTSSSDVPA